MGVLGRSASQEQEKRRTQFMVMCTRVKNKYTLMCLYTKENLEDKFEWDWAFTPYPRPAKAPKGFSESSCCPIFILVLLF